jgi:hypothetical protein
MGGDLVLNRLQERLFERERVCVRAGERERVRVREGMCVGERDSVLRVYGVRCRV